ncbi:MAG: flagellar biosynthesis regulator FlaF [Labrys sp. (in: a-proteobacteria)]
MQGAQAYSKVAKVTVSPRELEATLLLKAAAKLQAVSEQWAGMSPQVDDALAYNRKLWVILMTAVTRPENPLPKPVKENVANLGLFIMNHTMGILSDPNPDKLGVLVTINRELAAGLRG